MPNNLLARFIFLFLAFSLLISACNSPAASTGQGSTPATPTEGLATATRQPATSATLAAQATPSATPKPFTPPPSETPEARLLELQSPPLSGEDVEALQNRLLELGYAEVGWSDGIFSVQTDAAVRHFQYRNQLPVNGKLDEGTQSALASDQAVSYFPLFPFPGVTLAETAATCDEHMLKDRLATLGFMEPGLGDWQLDTIGAPTKKAMTAFFKANNLPNDGVMDLADWNVLFGPGVIDANGEGRPQPSGDAAWQTSVYAVPGQPFDLAWDGTRLWVAVYDAPYGMPALYIVDPTAPPYAAVSALRAGACNEYELLVSNITFARNRVWALLSDPNTGAQKLQGIGAQNALVSKPVAFGDCSQGCFSSSALGFDGASLWASSNNLAWALNANSGAALFSVEVGWMASGEMVFDGKDCMYLNGESGIVAFSIRGAPCGSYDNGLYAGGLAWDGTRMWNASFGTLISYDPKTRQYSDPIEIPGGNNALAFDGTRLWITSSQNWTVQAMDVATGGMGEPVVLAGEPAALLYDGARLWIAHSTGTVQVIDPQSYVIPLVTPVPTPTLAPTSAATATPTITPAPTFVRDLYLISPNMSGDDVLLLQNRLKALGYNVVPDGVFGALTDAAVRLFQERNALTVDGWVGAKTWNALFSPQAQGP
jgi:peptidoglycan hydrolase-like protein with peptidoglycan-binding domain